MRLAWTIGTIFALSVFPASGGDFRLSDSTLFDPFIVVHPPGYDGVGGGLQVAICIAPGSSILTAAAEQVIPVWNELLATTENCEGCRLWEEGESDGQFYFMNMAMLHEIGHCAMGLGHSNWATSTEIHTSFTNSKEAVAIDAGADSIRGTGDDIPSPFPGTRLLHWFRITDNDPFAIDGAVIDINTYSRRIIDLPGGQTWPANGNRGVGDFFGLQNTQNVMYSGGAREQRYLGLSPDEVNTVQFGAVGVDELAGTKDDYTVTLVLVDDCAMADIELRFEEITSGLGVCLSDLSPLPTMGAEVHHVAIPAPGEERIVVTINSAKRWDAIFADGFESGDFSAWSSME